MEKFMLLTRGGENHAHNATQSQAAKDNMQAWVKWMGEMAQKGTLVSAEPLQPVGKQISGNQKLVTDGPFMESKEVIGGYLVINASNIDEAVEIAKGCPIFSENGKIEVRPIQKMEM
ncbi:MAG: YciI family protein [Flavobacteriales bacterium]